MCAAPAARQRGVASLQVSQFACGARPRPAILSFLENTPTATPAVRGDWCAVTGFALRHSAFDSIEDLFFDFFFYFSLKSFFSDRLYPDIALQLAQVRRLSVSIRSII